MGSSARAIRRADIAHTHGRHPIADAHASGARTSHCCVRLMLPCMGPSVPSRLAAHQRAKHAFPSRHAWGFLQTHTAPKGRSRREPLVIHLFSHVTDVSKNSERRRAPHPALIFSGGVLAAASLLLCKCSLFVRSGMFACMHTCMAHVPAAAAAAADMWGQEHSSSKAAVHHCLTCLLPCRAVIGQGLA